MNNVYIITMTDNNGNETETVEFLETVGGYLNGATTLLNKGVVQKIEITYKH